MATRYPGITSAPAVSSRVTGEPLLEVDDLVLSLPGDEKNPGVSFFIRPGELIAVTGMVEKRGTRLLETLAGLAQPAKGTVLFSDIELHKNARVLQPRIGYVQQGNHVHPNLTVFEVLNYTAELRLPSGTTRKIRRQRVEDVLAETGLTGQRSLQVKSLDAEQQKLVNIGAELVTKPDLLLLDLSLTNENPNRVMTLMRRLAGQGYAIMITTSPVKSLSLADRVFVFLEGGHLAWYGPPQEAQSFFLSHPQAIQSNGQKPGLLEILYDLGDLDEPQAKEWAERYRGQPAYKIYQRGEKQDASPDLMLEDRPLAHRNDRARSEKVALKPPRPPALRQLGALSSRNLKLLARDRAALALVFVLPLAGILIDLLASGRNMYDRVTGSSEQIIFSLALLVFLVMLFAGFAWAREIRKEAAAIHHERRSGLRLLPYLLSKVWLVGLFAIFQALAWTAAHVLLANVPGGLPTLINFFITLVFVTLIGGFIGLIASSLTPSSAAAGLLIALLVIPQLFISGGVRPFAEPAAQGRFIGWVAPSSTALKALVTAGGHGRDLSQDACLVQPAETRRGMSERQKESCTCLGANLFLRCNFPGIQQYAMPGLSGGQATASTNLESLRLPPQPIPSADTTLEDYRQQVDTYSGAIEQKWLDLSHYLDAQRLNNLAIGSAESYVTSEYDRFSPLFNASLPALWGMLLLDSTVLLLILSGILRRRDAVR